MTTDTLFELPVARTKKAGGLTVISPPLKWPGGKGGELDRILRARPMEYDRYFEPFVGGGAVYWSVPAKTPAWINDTSTDLIDLYRYAQDENAALFDHLAGIVQWWEGLQAFSAKHGLPLVSVFQDRRDLSPEELKLLVRDTVKAKAIEVMTSLPTVWDGLRDDFMHNVVTLVPRKVARMRKVEQDRGQLLPVEDVWTNLEGAFKACAYTSLRSAYNAARLAGERSPRQAALFFYLREFAYAAMFRFNGSGEFNVPYGGLSYNRKDFAAKADHLRSSQVLARLATTTIGCQDFESFLETHQPCEASWLLLDPPYDSDFSTYDGNNFDRSHHRRLAAVMDSLDCKVQLVIKATPAVLEIYSHDRWNVLAFDKRYLWTIKERNDRNATHLMITNYDPPSEQPEGPVGGSSRST